MSAAESLAAPPPHSATGPLDPDNDRRSSSLSDLAEPNEQEDLQTMTIDNDNDPEAIDTEAETERLEDSPFKRHKHQNVLLPAGSAGQFVSDVPKTEQMHLSLSESLPEASSSVDSSEEEARSVSDTPLPRKRKRSSYVEKSEVEAAVTQSPRVQKSPLSSSESPRLSNDIRTTSNGPRTANRDFSDSDSTASLQHDKDRPMQKSSKRMDGKVFSEADDPALNLVTDIPKSVGTIGDGGDVVDSNGDDAEGDDTAEVDPENANKSHEELAKKKSALDSLTALEKCFATLRDKLFDERLATANEELALLQKPDFVHPELLAMKEAIDHNKKQKTMYQQTFLKYKLETLQRESIATKHQVQSQYMQAVRELRDQSLDQLNKEFYQVQRERRSGNSNVADSLYLFSSNRSQQVRQQTAYNSEVSILSGVAKYVGFPSAPAIENARPNELEDDLRGMGIASQSTNALHNRLSTFRSTLSAPVLLNRQTPTPEESFLERNAWANPQHPAHQQQRQIHRQASQLSQLSHSVSTPIAMKNVEKRGLPQGTAPNGERPMKANLSRKPAARARGLPEIGRASSQGFYSDSRAGEKVVEGTTSPIPIALNGNAGTQALPSPHPRAASSPSQHKALLEARNGGSSDSLVSHALPKPLPFTQKPGSRATPPVRLPVKVEDSSRHSPVPTQFGSAASIITAGNGQLR